MSRTIGRVTGPAGRPLAASVESRPIAAARSRRRRLVQAAVVALGLAGLVLAYLRMASTSAVNADAAANALQAWDLLHGNLLLRGWTLSDVSFYPTELVQYALIEVALGLDGQVVHVAAALTYTLLIFFAALVAKGDATGRAAWLRIGVVVATLLVPVPHSGWSIVLSGPDHTGTAVPLLATWLLVDRRSRTPLRRWWPLGVAALLTVAQMGDPLALFIGALPLAAVSALRMLRTRAWRGTDGHLFLAAAGSVAAAQGALAALWWSGGFSVHSPLAAFGAVVDLPGHVWMAVRATALNYGAYLPFLTGRLEVAAGVVNLVTLALAAVAVGGTLFRLVRGTAGDRVAEVLAVAILVNLAAYVVSTQPTDLGSARQIVAVLPFGAALAGRVLGDRLPRLGRTLVPSVAVVAAVLVAAFVVQSVAAKPQPVEGERVAQWLAAHDLHDGLGTYWASNNLTLASHGQVRVAPVVGPGVQAFRWESSADWYDSSRHDARFIVVDLDHNSVDAVRARFGPPIERHDFGRWTVLVYDRNLLIDLPVQCGTVSAARLADCPPLPPKLPGRAEATTSGK